MILLILLIYIYNSIARHFFISINTYIIYLPIFIYTDSLTAENRNIRNFRNTYRQVVNTVSRSHLYASCRHS